MRPVSLPRGRPVDSADATAPRRCCFITRSRNGWAWARRITSASTTASHLAAITGLTTGAVTGVVARLERGGFVRREPHPHDGRQQLLHATGERVTEIREVLEPMRSDIRALLETLDTDQLATIAEFLSRVTDIAYRRMALMRSERIQDAVRHGKPDVGTSRGSTERPAARRVASPKKSAAKARSAAQRSGDSR